MNLGIVAVGYNRGFAIKRLLSRLKQVEYFGGNVTLIISIDKSDEQEVYEIAKNFSWPYGKCILKFQEKKLGCRNHILKCGTYMEEYNLDAIAVFEDDTYPSLAFYKYMREAVKFYCDNDKIAGISLYTYLWNNEAELPFQPAYSGYDTYFVQFASSWGQIWLRKQWKEFTDWYELHKEQDNETVFQSNKITQSVYSFPESSWLKYHITYCVDRNKYFVYPYEALATCFSEVGEHTQQSGIDNIQVPLMNNIDKNYNFQPVEKKVVSYDVFFEREQINLGLNIDNQDVMVDLYGKKQINENICFLLTTRLLPNKIIKSWGISMRPHEENVNEDIIGNNIYLYDMREKAEENRYKEFDKNAYYFRLIKSKMWYIKFGMNGIIKRLMRHS